MAVFDSNFTKTKTLTTLCQCELNLFFLATYIKEPEDITTSSVLFLIEPRHNQIFLQLVHVLSLRDFFLSIADNAELKFSYDTVNRCFSRGLSCHDTSYEIF